jgi:predicted transcriptional regulator
VQISVLLSVKPLYADAILDGIKKFEFRRVLFRHPDVRRIVLYASSPVQKVVGEFALADILTMRPAALWAITAAGSGIDRKLFDEYFRGRSLAHALKVRQPVRYRRPKDLSEHLGIWTPPQSFRYLA